MRAREKRRGGLSQSYGQAEAELQMGGRSRGPKEKSARHKGTEHRRSGESQRSVRAAEGAVKMADWPERIIAGTIIVMRSESRVCVCNVVMGSP